MKILAIIYNSEHACMALLSLYGDEDKTAMCQSTHARDKGSHTASAKWDEQETRVFMGKIQSRYHMVCLSVVEEQSWRVRLSATIACAKKESNNKQ